MLSVVFGDAVAYPGGILVHQVNYEGVMGGGIAYAIKKNLLPHAAYEEYVRRCEVGGKHNLGTVLWSKLPDSAPQKFVANCFSQLGPDNADEEFVDDGQTSYTALQRCLEEVRAFAIRKKLTVIIPGYIGCGIAGGNWERVQFIIYNVFMHAPVEAYICYLEPPVAEETSNGKKTK